MQVHIETSEGNNYALHLDQSATVGNLLLTLCTMEQVPPRHGRIVFHGQLLRDVTATLGQCGVAANDTLSFMLEEEQSPVCGEALLAHGISINQNPKFHHDCATYRPNRRMWSQLPPVLEVDSLWDREMPIVLTFNVNELVAASCIGYHSTRYIIDISENTTKLKIFKRSLNSDLLIRVFEENCSYIDVLQAVGFLPPPTATPVILTRTIMPSEGFMPGTEYLVTLLDSQERGLRWKFTTTSRTIKGALHLIKGFLDISFVDEKTLNRMKKREIEAESPKPKRRRLQELGVK